MLEIPRSIRRNKKRSIPSRSGGKKKNPCLRVQRFLFRTYEPLRESQAFRLQWRTHYHLVVRLFEHLQSNRLLRIRAVQTEFLAKRQKYAAMLAGIPGVRDLEPEVVSRELCHQLVPVVLQLRDQEKELSRQDPFYEGQVASRRAVIESAILFSAAIARGPD